MRNIFVQTSGTVGKKMTGPTIRAWEVAKALAKTNLKESKVFLIHPETTDIKGEGFELLLKNSPSYWQELKECDCIIVQNLNFEEAFRIKQKGIKIIIDAYDPLPLEMLELFKNDKINVRNHWLTHSTTTLIFNFHLADGIICASEKQRDLWLGFLMGQKLINIEKYDNDNSLRNFIDVVPFGLSLEKPLKNGPGIKERFSLDKEDSIIVWGGGIWNWFDPLTLIEAMKLLEKEHPKIKLVFMGIKMPDSHVPEMKMIGQALDLAKNLNLLNKTVFFNHDWVPYDQRQNFLLEASIGVSTHFDHLETRFSFRTRILDYLWTDLPILTTEGDSFAELVKKENLGKVVPYRDKQAIREAILELIDNEAEREKIKKSIQTIKPPFDWVNVIKPINRMLEAFPKDKNRMTWSDFKLFCCYLPKLIREKGIKKCFHFMGKRFKIFKK